MTPYAYNPHATGALGADPFASGQGTPGMVQTHDGKSSILTAGMAGAGAGAAYGAAHSSSHGHPSSNAPLSPNNYTSTSVSDPSEYPVSDASYYPGTHSGTSASGYHPNPHVAGAPYAPGQAPYGYGPNDRGFPGGFRGPSPGPSSSEGWAGPAAAGAAVGGPTAFRNPVSAKEREALARRGVANPTPSEVVQHQDGGRVPQREGEEGEGEGEEGPSEIPPSYDSIPADERGRR